MTDWQRLNDDVQALHERFDQSNDAWLARFRAQGGRLHCGRGCAGCCTLTVNATLAEAAVVAEGLSDALAGALRAHVPRLLAVAGSAPDLKSYLRRQRQEVGPCPFLAADGACGIYGCRPLACRSLYATRPADYCATDFAALHPLEREAFLSSLDRDVVAFPTHYAAVPQELGRELEGELCWRMRQVLGFAITGSFVFLVWLLRERALLTNVGQGATALRGFLTQEGLDSPWLLSFEENTSG